MLFLLEAGIFLEETWAARNRIRVTIGRAVQHIFDVMLRQQPAGLFSATKVERAGSARLAVVRTWVPLT